MPRGVDQSDGRITTYSWDADAFNKDVRVRLRDFGRIKSVLAVTNPESGGAVWMDLVYSHLSDRTLRVAFTRAGSRVEAVSFEVPPAVGLDFFGCDRDVGYQFPRVAVSHSDDHDRVSRKGVVISVVQEGKRYVFSVNQVEAVR